MPKSQPAKGNGSLKDRVYRNRQGWVGQRGDSCLLQKDTFYPFPLVGVLFLGYIPPLCSDLCGTDRNQGIFRYRYRVCKSLTIFCRRTFVCIKPGIRVTNWHISRKKVYRFLSLVREPGRVPYLTILLRQKNTNGLLMRVGVDCILAVIKFGRGNLSFQTG